MTRLVRLYPKAWRDRYEVEFVGLLRERPPSIRDLVDVAASALDAHLNPHLADPEAEAPRWTHRIPGLLALVGGAIWTALIVFVLVRPGVNQDWVGLIMASIFLMFLSLPGDYMAAHGRQVGIALGLIGVCFVVANLVPWDVASVISLFTFLLITGGMLTLAAIRAGIGPAGRWILLALSVALPAAIATIPLSGLAVLGEEGGRLLFGLAILYGIGWIVVGMRLVIRGAPTFVEPHLHPLAPEVVRP
jgi:hypothetical protein